MGANQSKTPDSSEVNCSEKCAPAENERPKLNRETATLKEKELLATEDMMRELHRLKEFDAELALSKSLKPEDNSAFEYDYVPYTLPLDEEGYVQAFEPDQEDEYLAFFRRYGVVVVKNVLSEEDTSRSVDQLWDFLERHSETSIDGQTFRLDRNDPSTWVRPLWPGLDRLGILGNLLILSPQFCQNRQNPRVARVFEVILGTPKLWVNVGRASAMRPTRQVRMPKNRKNPFEKDGLNDFNADGAKSNEAAGSSPSSSSSSAEEEFEFVDKPEWKTVMDWLHWDMNPFTGQSSTFSFKNNLPAHHLNRGYDKTDLQAVMALVDCGPNEGGFHCTPGVQNHLRGWANKNQGLFKNDHVETAGSMQIPSGDEFRQNVQKVPIRRGSLMIWSSCLPHGTFPNDSDKMRMIQYIQMIPANPEGPMQVLFDDENLLPPESDFQLSPLGRKLYGFEKWE